MTQIALLIAICLSSPGNTSVQLKPDRVIDRWEITNSEWDNETLVLRKDGSFSHIYLNGDNQKTESGAWRLKEGSVRLTSKNGKELGSLRFAPGTTVHQDSLVIGPDTVAERSYWVAEQRLINKLSSDTEGMNRSLGNGVAYRVGFWSGKNPHFAVDLWPMQVADIERLKTQVVADLRKLGLRPVHPIRYDVRGF